jgi:hypothetical protein
VFGDVLAIGIHLDHCVEAVALGEQEGRAHRPPDADVERHLDHLRPSFRRDVAGAVVGAVIDDQDVRVGHRAPHLGNDAADRGRLVQRRDGHERAGHGGTLPHHGVGVAEPANPRRRRSSVPRS